MEELKVLIDFYSVIQNDNRIGATHISLYLALYYFYVLNQFQNPVFIKRVSVMYGAKICGLATYHKCIRDLNDFGYILYKPSYNPHVGSMVYFVNLSGINSSHYRPRDIQVPPQPME